MKCEYGCDEVGLYTLKNGKLCCSPFSSQCKSIRKKNSKGLKRLYETGQKQSVFRFNKDHVIQSHESYKNNLRQKPFELWGNKLRRDYVLEEQNNKCAICYLSEWQSKPLKLHIDHIDGNNGNNLKHNLRALCPNCHSQTETYCGKNINSGHKKVSDDDLYEALLNSNSTAEALKKVGLAPKGGNYSRVKRIKIERSLGNL